jgi:hypothetical protein
MAQQQKKIPPLAWPRHLNKHSFGSHATLEVFGCVVCFFTVAGWLAMH